MAIALQITIEFIGLVYRCLPADCEWPVDVRKKGVYSSYTHRLDSESDLPEIGR